MAKHDRKEHFNAIRRKKLLRIYGRILQHLFSVILLMLHPELNFQKEKTWLLKFL